MRTALTHLLITMGLAFSAWAEEHPPVPNGEDDFYKGSYAPDGDYILNGGLIGDLPPPIKVPVHYKAPAAGSASMHRSPAPCNALEP